MVICRDPPLNSLTMRREGGSDFTPLDSDVRLVLSCFLELLPGSRRSGDLLRLLLLCELFLLLFDEEEYLLASVSSLVLSHLFLFCDWTVMCLLRRSCFFVREPDLSASLCTTSAFALDTSLGSSSGAASGTVLWAVSTGAVSDTSTVLSTVSTGEVSNTVTVPWTVSVGAVSVTGTAISTVLHGHSCSISTEPYPEEIKMSVSHWQGVMGHCSCMHYLHRVLDLPSTLRVAYAANISKHSTIIWEIDHHTGNFVAYYFWTLRNYLWCEGSLAFRYSVDDTLLQAGSNECYSGNFQWNSVTVLLYKVLWIKS